MRYNDKRSVNLVVITMSEAKWLIAKFQTRHVRFEVPVTKYIFLPNHQTVVL